MPPTLSTLATLPHARAIHEHRAALSGENSSSSATARAGKLRSSASLRWESSRATMNRPSLRTMSPKSGSTERPFSSLCGIPRACFFSLFPLFYFSVRFRGPVLLRTSGPASYSPQSRLTLALDAPQRPRRVRGECLEIQLESLAVGLGISEASLPSLRARFLADGCSEPVDVASASGHSVTPSRTSS